MEKEKKKTENRKNVYSGTFWFFFDYFHIN